MARKTEQRPETSKLPEAEGLSSVKLTSLAKLGQGEVFSQARTKGGSVRAEAGMLEEKYYVAERDEFGVWAKNVKVMSSARQHHPADISKRNRSVYTERVVSLIPQCGSWEKAHEQCKQEALSSHKKGKFVPIPENSAGKLEERWTTCRAVDSDRVVLLISGQPQAINHKGKMTEEADLKAFEADFAAVAEVCTTRLGVARDKVFVLRKPSPEHFAAELRNMTRKGKQLLIYFTGHNVPIDPNVGVIAEPRMNSGQGSDIGALHMDKSRQAAYLTEFQAKAFVNQVAPSFPKGITLVVDACFSGSWVAKSAPPSLPTLLASRK